MATSAYDSGSVLGGLGGEAQNVPPAAATRTEMLYASVANNNSMLTALAERMEHLRDKLIGCPTEAAGVAQSGNERQAIGSRIALIEEGVEWQANMIVRLSNIMGDLESL